MSLRLSVGVSQKIGLRDYGSAGASCSLELELAGSLLGDQENLQQQIRQAYALCQQAVQDELARHGQNGETRPEAAKTPEGAARRTENGARNGSGHIATPKQLDYARQLAGQIDGLGVRKLETLAQRMFGKPVAALTSLDASGLIDCLKGIKAGEIDLAAALNGAAT